MSTNGKKEYQKEHIIVNVSAHPVDRNQIVWKFYKQNYKGSKT